MSTNTYLRQKSIRCKFNTEEWCRMVVNQVSYSYKSTATILRIDGNRGCGLMFYETELSIAPPQIRGTYGEDERWLTRPPRAICRAAVVEFQFVRYFLAPDFIGQQYQPVYDPNGEGGDGQ